MIIYSISVDRYMPIKAELLWVSLSRDAYGARASEIVDQRAHSYDASVVFHSSKVELRDNSPTTLLCRCLVSHFPTTVILLCLVWIM